jgi:hypothetical protein
MDVASDRIDMVDCEDILDAFEVRPFLVFGLDAAN